MFFHALNTRCLNNCFHFVEPIVNIILLCRLYKMFATLNKWHFKSYSDIHMLCSLYKKIPSMSIFIVSPSGKVTDAAMLSLIDIGVRWFLGNTVKIWSCDEIQPDKPASIWLRFWLTWLTWLNWLTIKKRVFGLLGWIGWLGLLGWQ